LTNRTLFTLSGIVLIAGGLWALFAPVTASLAATYYVGAAFAVAGAFHILHGLREAEDRVWSIAFGLLGVLLGLSLFVNPLAGMVSLTLVLGGLFAGSGAMQLYLAWKRRHRDRVLFLALSGIVSLVLAALIAVNLFTAAVLLPGIVLAVELISTGVALLTLRPLLRGRYDHPEDAHP
jgi:uncharacterized membrane protein HdeD (DUF308 family)